MKDFIQRTLNPCFSLSALFMFSVCFLRVVKNSLISFYPASEGLYPHALALHLQLTSGVVILAAIVGYLFYCRKAELKNALFAPLKWLTLTLGALGILLFFTPSLTLPKSFVSLLFPDSGSGYAALLSHWNVTLLFYALSLLSSTLFSATLWASANISSRSEDRKENYLTLALAIGFGTSVGYLLFNPTLHLISRSFSQATYVALAIGLFGLSLGQRILKTWLKRFALAERSSRTHIEPISKESLKSLIVNSAIIGLLVAGVAFLQVVEKSTARSLFPSPTEYATLIGKFAIALGSASLILQIGAAALGTRAIKQGFFKRFLAISVISVIIALGAFVSFSFISPGPLSIFSFALLKAMIGALAYFVFIPLAQAKIADQPLGQQLLLQMLMILLFIPAISSSLPTLFMQLTIVAAGSIKSALPLFAALGCLAVLGASHMIYRRFIQSRSKSTLKTL